MDAHRGRSARLGHAVQKSPTFLARLLVSFSTGRSLTNSLTEGSEQGGLPTSMKCNFIFLLEEGININSFIKAAE